MRTWVGVSMLQFWKVGFWWVLLSSFVFLEASCLCLGEPGRAGSDDSVLLAEGGAAGLQGGAVDRWLFVGGADGDAGGEKIVLNAGGGEYVEEATASGAHVGPTVRNVSGTEDVGAGSTGDRGVADCDLEEAVEDVEGFVLVEVFVEGYALPG